MLHSNGTVKQLSVIEPNSHGFEGDPGIQSMFGASLAMMGLGRGNPYLLVGAPGFYASPGTRSGALFWLQVNASAAFRVISFGVWASN